MSYRRVLFDTYQNVVKTGDYGLIIQNIGRLGARYIARTSRTAYRKIHSNISAILDKIISHPEASHKYIADLVEASILIKYQSERNQLNRDLADELISILEDYIRDINKLKDKKDVRKRARVIKMIIDSILAFYYHRFSR